VRINRGKLSLEGIAAEALELNAEKVVIVDRWKGGPGKIELYKFDGKELHPTPPLIYLKGVKLRREFRTMPKGRRIKSTAMVASPRPSREVSRLEKALSDFFGIPTFSSENECGGFDALMKITGSQVGELAVTFKLLPENLEIGPRMRISHLIWDLKP